MTQHGECAPRWARVIGASLLGLGCFTASAAAQLARLPASANAPKLLVAPFGRDRAADSALSSVAADGLRQRMLTSHTGDFATITKEAVCKALEESGFSCNQPLEPSQIGQLAHLLNARYMVDGMVFPHGADSVLVLARLLQTVRQNPLAASASLVTDRAKGATSIGSALADRLSDKFRSFEPITNCRAALDARDFTKATEAANRALRYDRESGGAYLCLAQVLQANGGSTDSVQAVYERAHDADSLNTLVGRQLYLIYEAKHDTTQMLHMLHHILQVDVNDNDIKKVAVQIQVQRGHPDSAVAILDDALGRNPNQVDLLVLRAISLSAQNKYADAAASMAAAAAVDSAKIDSLFVARTLAFYDAASDSANAFTWRRICTVRTPGNGDCWFKYAAGLYDRQDTNGAIGAIRHLIALHPETGRGQIVLANWLGAAGQIDSSLAYAMAAVAADSSWRPQAAAMFLRAGYVAFQAKEYPKTIQLLSQVQPWATGQPQVTIAYLLGNSQFNIGLATLQDLQHARAVTTNTKDRAAIDSACAMIRTISDNFTPAQTNIAAGAAVSRDAANQILTYVGNVMPALGQIRTRLKCPQ
jgi:tetratricopeptide (TPR) repeat protein